MKNTINSWKRNDNPPPVKQIEGCNIILSTEKWKNMLTFPVGEESHTIKTLEYKEGECVSVVFYDEILIKAFSKCTTISVDGTFRCVPKIGQAKQMITLMGKVNDKFFPFIWVLTNSKTQKNYENVFYLIREKLLGSFVPILCISDFEKAMQNSIKTVFPEINLQGCYFHYTYDLRKYFQKCGIFEQIKAAHLALSSKIIVAKRKLYNLPLLPPQHIQRGFYLIKNGIEQDPVLKQILAKFLIYFERQWVKKTNANTLSVFQAPDRTNNSQERYHRMLNKLIRKRPRFPKFCCNYNLIFI
ncbi:uncharacterized protein [Prorops nasuta]